MNTVNIRLAVVALLALPAIAFLSGCDALTSKNSEEGDVTMTGLVLNSETNNPVAGAFIRVLPPDLLFETDAEGRYNFTVRIDSTMELRLIASKDGFRESQVDVLALAGRIIEVPTLKILRIVGQENLESGLASNIVLFSQSSANIGVKESGSQEVAQIEFQVADSSGRPIVIGKSATIRFSFGVQPGGGEFLWPNEASTDNNGLVSVNISSGTKAGVVQIVAQTTVNGREIRSMPVAISIHGGLPDQAHFSIGPSTFNFPGLNTFGLVNQISVIVGDKYSNPVRLGTSVYFSTSHGVIDGSILTDDQGQGTVDLVSANPLPADGIGLVTAGTADEGNISVTGSTPVVFSGFPVITVGPAMAVVNQTYSLTVTDQNGNPLVRGTSISVQVEGTAVKGVGNTNVILDETIFSGGNLYENVVRGLGSTQFTFRAVEDVDPNATNPETPFVEAITIRVSGPNGKLEVVLGPAGKGYVPGDGVEAEILPDGSLVARAPVKN